MKDIKIFLQLVLLIVVTVQCKQSPKVISASNEKANPSQTGIFSDANESDHNHADHTLATTENNMHRVMVKEVLPTEKYVYLRVTENDEDFWIASSKQAANVGDIFMYRGGLLKTNFESKEYDRMFDKVYLVSNLIKENSTSDHASHNKSNIEMHGPGEKNTRSADRYKRVDGSIKIAELIKNISNYEGKTIQLSGECVKINPNILQRNWIHLKDGSMDTYDLVVTSDMIIPEGSFVTLTGRVVLNQDFGSGYKYDLLIENGKIK